MTVTILVLTDQRSGTLTQSSLEVLGEAHRLAAKSGGGEVVAGVLGHQLGPAVASVQAGGPQRIFTVDDPRLAAFGAAAYAAAARAVLSKLGPNPIILAPATAFGRELLPRLGAAIGGAVATDVVEIAPRPEGGLRIARTVFGGKATERWDLPGTALASLRPNAFAAERKAGSAPVENVPLGALPPSAEGLSVESRVSTRGDTPELTESPIVVSGGRGLKAPENFALVEGLAAALGGAVGASRAVVDAGWKPASYQVGQTGKVVAPQLYIAAGISGAIQHLVGITNSRCIVAINKDPGAPIFKVANYGIVGDALQILPALTAAVQRSKG